MQTFGRVVAYETEETTYWLIKAWGDCALGIHDVEVLHDVERKTDDEQEFHDTHGGTEQTVGETEFQMAQKVVETIGHESQSDGKEDAEDEEGNDAQHHIDLRAVDCKIFP